MIVLIYLVWDSGGVCVCVRAVCDYLLTQLACSCRSQEELGRGIMVAPPTPPYTRSV